MLFPLDVGSLCDRKVVNVWVAELYTQAPRERAEAAQEKEEKENETLGRNDRV